MSGRAIYHNRLPIDLKIMILISLRVGSTSFSEKVMLLNKRSGSLFNL